MYSIIALLALLAAPALQPTRVPDVASAQEPSPLRATFIGNMAFAISDGETTLFSDFPYRSGAFGYMEYNPGAIRLAPDGVSLITHEHADHWDARAFSGMQSWLVAHPDISAQVPESRVLPWSERIDYKGMIIEPIATEHTDAHNSYRVTWHGVRMYFTGDTEDLSDLLAQTDLDVAFVSVWLAERIAREGLSVDADRILIYHHTVGERRAMPDNAMLPAQGDTFTLPFG
jgi:L-ascorbate metabolism protein UlaG (beta-lactamase superfamily)